MLRHLIYLFTLVTVAQSIPVLPFRLSSRHLQRNTSHQHDLTHPLSTNLTSLSSYWHCYGEQPRLNQPDLRHCTRVLAGIRHLNLPQRPLLFSRSETADFVLPVRFSYQTCTVMIDVEDREEEAEDFLSRWYLINQIEALEDRCIVQPPFLGGEGKLGWRGKLRMSITGPIDPEVRFQ